MMIMWDFFGFDPLSNENSKQENLSFQNEKHLNLENPFFQDFPEFQEMEGMEDVKRRRVSKSKKEKMKPKPQKDDSHFAEMERKKKLEKAKQKKVIGDFLMKGINKSEKVSRENPSFGSIIYRYLRSNVRNNSQRTNKLTKYCLKPDQQISEISKGKCTNELADWIWEREFVQKPEKLIIEQNETKLI
ncbi:hypothetical protein M0811_00773 [Anaeramoeba ignava]|uniref:Uncharacterized protein n=1 Tax=Anaeramoeba ignava TaxID=1746090 RepID=A0A9Q0LLU9_ANAIG|nr:hypothetical protein M0811_00773 [Anaeramoeba ignava]